MKVKEKAETVLICKAQKKMEKKFYVTDEELKLIDNGEGYLSTIKEGLRLFQKIHFI